MGRRATVDCYNVMTSRTERSLRSDYPHLHLITTRWHDNDVYGHVNNVQYYAFFDTTVNHFLLENNVLDFERGEVIGLVVASIGNSSVRYEIGLFRAEAGDALDDFAVGQERAIAEGHFVHVYVDRHQRRPKSLPQALRQVLESILIRS